MKLSEIKGKRQMAVLADVLELADSLSERPELDAFVDEVRAIGGDQSKAWRAFCKLSPIIRDEEVQDRLVAIIASAKGMDAETVAEECDIVSELFELLTSDSEILAFFGSTERNQD